MRHGTVKDYLSNCGGCVDFTVDGKCSGCGQCCSNLLPLSKKEVDRIKAFVRTHNIKKQRHLMPFAQAAEFDLCCPFLDISKKQKCTIYEVRPLICKSFFCNSKDFNEELLDEYRNPVNMTETFFG